MKFASLILGALIFCATSSAQAASLDKNKFRYDVYAGGLKGLAAELTLNRQQGSSYTISLEAKTQGLIGRLFPWSGQFRTTGRADGARLVPKLHKTTGVWRGKPSVTEMKYDATGRLISATSKDGAKPATKMEINKTLADGATDMLSAAVMIFDAAARKGRCSGSFPVFDGRRKFNITLRDLGTESLKPSRYSRFSGTAMKCTVTVVPTGGFNARDRKRGWMAVQSHTQARNKMPTLWLARLGKSGPAVPVRMEISSDYGSVVAHLAP